MTRSPERCYSAFCSSPEEFGHREPLLLSEVPIRSGANRSASANHTRRASRHGGSAAASVRPLSVGSSAAPRSRTRTMPILMLILMLYPFGLAIRVYIPPSLNSSRKRAASDSWRQTR